MKKNIQRLLFILVFGHWSCSKNSYSIRFRNNFGEEMDKVVVGSAVFGTVLSGQTSDYRVLNTQNFLISGTTSLGHTLASSGSVSGVGTHKWTITMTGAGTITITKDE